MMIKKRSFGELAFDTLNTILMLILVILTLYPFIYIVFASISNPNRLIEYQGLLFYPLGLSFDSYLMVFDNPMILIGYRNTLLYVLAGTCVNLFLTSMGAYVLSRKGYLLKKFLTFFFVFTMFFSGGLIPFYLAVKQMGIADTIWALILPPAINTYNLIIMRTAFAAIPDSMEESARIDSAGDFTILFKIIIPLSMPVVAVMILFYGVYHWNAWINAMIFIRNRDLLPLQTILREILIASVTDNMTTSISPDDRDLVSQTIKYATIIVATIPILFIYPFLQKYFVKGIMIGAIKE